LGFAVGTVMIAAVGYAALLVAFFGGAHDPVGKAAFVCGAIGTTGGFVVIGRVADSRVRRIAAAVLATLIACGWLVELPSFLTSHGWQF